jgi:hypothetical protein
MSARPADAASNVTFAEQQLNEQRITSKYSNLLFYLGEQRITAAFSIQTSHQAQNIGINRSKGEHDA